jgi:hypothetical protein
VQSAFDNVVEIDVHIETAARTGLVDAAAHQFVSNARDSV